MTNTEKWNKICDIFNKNINSPEDEIQKIWEKILSEIFGYSSLDGDIEAHRKMQLGSTERLIPDIIIKNQNEDLFAIELKQENLPVSQQYLEQTFSYLNQLKCDLGILICNKICLIDYVYNKSNNEQTKFEIDFTKDNPDGIKFVELFSKENFNKDAVKEFIRTKEMAVKNVEDIKKEISNSLIMDLLKQYFSEKYSEEEFDKAVKGFEIEIKEKSNKISPVNNVVTSETKSILLDNRSAPPIEFYINGKTASKKEFKELLLQVKTAKRILHYSSGPVEEIWDAGDMKPSSNLVGNIRSSKCRNWKESGLLKIICEISTL